MDRQARQALLQRYKEGYGVLEAAASSLSESELDRLPPDGSWTARQVIHHLADSEMTSAIRLRRLIAEDEPLILGYDEELFARTLFYTSRPIAPSLAALEAARETSADILDCLSEAQWARSGSHSESGPYGIETWLDIYASHAHDHADQLLRAAGRL